MYEKEDYTEAELIALRDDLEQAIIDAQAALFLLTDVIEGESHEVHLNA